MSAKKSVRVTQVKSEIGFDRRQRKTLLGLGLRHLNQTVSLEDSPSVRGMIRGVRHLVKVEEA